MNKQPTPTRLCKLSEFGECKRRFKPKVPWMDFCKPKHQQRYWTLVRREKRLLVKKVMEHEKEIKTIKRHLGLK